MLLALAIGCGGGGLVADEPVTSTADGAPEDGTNRGDADSEVHRVIDGDTVLIDIDGARETVRLVGIDAPEGYGPYRETGCFGPEAAERLRELLPGGTAVRVETDPAQNPRDKFDRLLGYVWRDGDAISVNQQMVADGMALVYVFRDDPFSETEAFRRSEDEARSEQLGVWGACGPDGRAPATDEGSDRSCPDDAPIKGNLPSAIYHSPGDENYAGTKPERCFATGADAEAEGFRPAGR